MDVSVNCLVLTRIFPCRLVKGYIFGGLKLQFVWVLGLHLLIWGLNLSNTILGVLFSFRGPVFSASSQAALLVKFHYDFVLVS